MKKINWTQQVPAALVSRTSFVLMFTSFLLLFLATIFFFASPKANVLDKAAGVPMLDYTIVRKQSVRIPLFSHGVTRAETAIPIVTEVSGNVVQLSENFAAGGFFQRGELLLQLDSSAYELDLIKKQSLVDSAVLALERAQAAAKVAAQNRQQQAELGLHIPQLKYAKSQLAAAEADLQLAQLKLNKTRITAPFDGRVIKAHVGFGQYLQPGQALADIYKHDIIEVRLPISDRQLSLLEHRDFLSPTKQMRALPVLLNSSLAGQPHTWEGQIVRAEGGRDKNGLLYLVAQVYQPRGQSVLPLDIGVFVEAEIFGRKHKDIAILPPEALSSRNQVWVIDEAMRLRSRRVSVVHRGKNALYIDEGLNDGDYIALGKPSFAMENTPVKLSVHRVAAVSASPR